MKLILISLMIIFGTSCATMKKPSGYFLAADQALFKFQTDLDDQYRLGTMTLENYNTIMLWILRGRRMLLKDPEMWEDFARIDWPKIQSLISSYESFEDVNFRINSLLQ